MLVLTRRIAPPAAETPCAELPLPFEYRQKSRFRTRMPDGEDVGWFIDRGQPLRGGDGLQAEDGRTVRIVAAPEPLLHVTAADAITLNRAAYHLGNRHVALQVGDGWLRLLDDYVLADMLAQLGVHAAPITAPFEPEAGAYGGGHHHSHTGGHGDAEFRQGPKIHEFRSAGPTPA